MRSVAVCAKLYIDRGQEITNWLQENEAVTLDSIVHPFDNYSSTPRIIITFEDSNLAILFKLMWG